MNLNEFLTIKANECGIQWPCVTFKWFVIAWLWITLSPIIQTTYFARSIFQSLHTFLISFAAVLKSYTVLLLSSLWSLNVSSGVNKQTNNGLLNCGEYA